LEDIGMKRSKGWMTICLAAAGMLSLAGCSSFSPPPTTMVTDHVGENCTVYYRHNMLGTSGIMASPLSDEVNGTQLSVHGKLIEEGADWIRLEVGKEEVTIPREVILTIKTQTKSK
jgi:hypothetical protein